MNFFCSCHSFCPSHPTLLLHHVRGTCLLQLTHNSSIAPGRPMAILPENNPKSVEKLEDLEYQFWRNLRFQPPLYGADVEGSLFDEDLQVGTKLMIERVTLGRPHTAAAPARFLVLARLPFAYELLTF